MRSPTTVRRALALVACLALATVMAACGSDGEGDEAGERDTEAICASVDQFRDAAATNDRADMAAAIRPIVEDLPEEVARQAEAYIVTLNGSETFTGTANDRSKEEFLAYADETCGEGGGSGASTTSTSPGATSTTMPDDLTPTTTAATGDGSTGTNEGSGDGGDSSGSGGSTESDGSTGSSGNSDPATSGPSEGTGG